MLCIQVLLAVTAAAVAAVWKFLLLPDSPLEVEVLFAVL